MSHGSYRRIHVREHWSHCSSRGPVKRRSYWSSETFGRRRTESYGVSSFSCLSRSRGFSYTRRIVLERSFWPEKMKKSVGENG